MPSTVASIFAAAGCTPAGVVRWGERVPLTEPGVYVVSLTRDLDSLTSAVPKAPIAMAAVLELLDRRRELRLDRRPTTPAELAERLARFWLPDEVAVYIGLSTRPLRKRVDEYYATPLGAARPHSGGWFLKTLDVLGALYVHYAPSADPTTAEHRMLAAFSAAVSAETSQALHDRDRPIPFANLEWPRRRYKRHGITGAREPKGKPRASAPPRRSASDDDTSREQVPLRAADAVYRTQRVSAADIRKGQIRIPSGSPKAMFPRQRDGVTVELRGERFTCRWDPRLGSDKTRSGIISIGLERATRLLTPEDVLEIRRAGDVVVLA